MNRAIQVATAMQAEINAIVVADSSMAPGFSGKIAVLRKNIVSTNRGWVTYRVGKEERKARASQLEVLEQPLRRVGNKKYDCSKYQGVVTPAGNTSMDNADSLAQELRELDLEEVYKKASKVLDLPQTDLEHKYAHLNVGMQRMCLGNRLRAALRGLPVGGV